MTDSCFFDNLKIMNQNKKRGKKKTKTLDDCKCCHDWVSFMSVLKFHLCWPSKTYLILQLYEEMQLTNVNEQKLTVVIVTTDHQNASGMLPKLALSA